FTLPFSGWRERIRIPPRTGRRTTRPACSPGGSRGHGRTAALAHQHSRHPSAGTERSGSGGGAVRCASPDRGRWSTRYAPLRHGKDHIRASWRVVTSRTETRTPGTENASRLSVWWAQRESGGKGARQSETLRV